MKITTTGRDGIYEFNVEEDHSLDYDGERWNYLIRSKEHEGEYFELRFIAMDDKRVRIDVLHRHGLKEFEAKGIPEEIFELVVQASRRYLVSSLPNAPDEAEYRTHDADKMWRRLVRANRARYDDYSQRYEFLPRP